jgi:DNA-binding CsgD family transcriptional regulator
VIQGAGAAPVRRAVGRSFVGRRADLDELRRALDDALTGRGRLVLLAGEPGIGKTRLAEELAAEATQQGCRVLWANCWEGESASGFWPWIQLLRAYAREQERAALRAVLGDTGADVLRLVPELGVWFPELGVPADELGEGDRLRLFDGVATFWKRAAASETLVLVLDDLHWCDPTSLQLLRFVARELRGTRLLIVGTYRDVEVTSEHPLAQFLGELTGERSDLHLGGLTPAEVGGLLVELTSTQFQASSIGAVHAQTGGNPFFVRELARLLVSQPTPDLSSVLRELPTERGPQDIIRRRVARLSEGCRAQLSAGAVIGQDFSRSVLESATGTSRTELVGRLEEAQAARLIEPVTGAATDYRFSHALVRGFLYSRLSVDQRVHLHQRIGEVLEARLSHAPSEQLAQVAHHFLRAALDGGVEVDKAVRYGRLAGERAMGQLAYAEAAVLFQLALDALDLVDDSHPGSFQTRAELWLAIAQAQLAAGAVEAARAADVHAADIARRSGQPTLLARAALGLGLDFTAGVADPLEIQLLEEALVELPPADQPLRARVLARLARALLFTPDAERRRQLSERAVDMARRLDDPATLAAVLADRHVAIWGGANAEERLAIANEVVALAERCGAHGVNLQGRALRLGNLLELGQLAAMRAEIEAYDQVIHELRDVQFAWHVPLLRATLALINGRWDETERLAQEGLALGQRARHQGIAVFHPTVMTVLRLLQGRLSELVEPLREVVARYPSIPAWRATLALALCEADDHASARAEFGVLAADGFAAVPRDFTYVCSLAILSLLAAELGDTRRAAQLQTLLQPYARYTVRITRIGVAWLGPVAYYLGRLAATLGQWDAAVGHLEQAVDLNLQLEARPYLAVSQQHLASALLERNRSGDFERARACIDSALAMADVLDLPRVRASLISLQGPRAHKGTPRADRLTPREVEVLRLMAAGRSNQQIADELVISLNTVLHHVSHIFGKIGATNRAAAATYAARYEQC